MSLLDELGFCMRYCANPQCEREGGDEESLDRHGFRERKFGVVPPRLLQDHSPSGESHRTALVQSPRGSGEFLVRPRLQGSKNRAKPGCIDSSAVGPSESCEVCVVMNGESVPHALSCL